MRNSASSPSGQQPVVHTVVVLAAIISACFAGPVGAEEPPIARKRMVLLYGTHRVEHAPSARPSDDTGPPDRLMLIGGADLDNPKPRPPAVFEEDSPEAIALPPIPEVDGLLESLCITRSFFPDGDCWQALQHSAVPLVENPLREHPTERPTLEAPDAVPVPTQPATAEVWHGRLLESVLQRVFCSLKAVLQRTYQTGRRIIETASVPHSDTLPKLATEVEPAASESLIRATPDRQVETTTDYWLFTGIAQATGTVVGLLLGGLVGALILLLVRNRPEVKFEPIIRLEMPPLGSTHVTGINSDRGDDADAAFAQTTPVADFRDEAIPFDLSAMAIHQRSEEANRNRQRQEELLRQIYEENLAFREAAAARAA